MWINSRLVFSVPLHCLIHLQCRRFNCRSPRGCWQTFGGSFCRHVEIIANTLWLLKSSKMNPRRRSRPLRSFPARPLISLEAILQRYFFCSSFTYGRQHSLSHRRAIKLERSKASRQIPSTIIGQGKIYSLEYSCTGKVFFLTLGLSKIDYRFAVLPIDTIKGNQISASSIFLFQS